MGILRFSRPVSYRTTAGVPGRGRFVADAALVIAGNATASGNWRTFVETAENRVRGNALLQIDTAC